MWLVVGRNILARSGRIVYNEICHLSSSSLVQGRPDTRSNNKVIRASFSSNCCFSCCKTSNQVMSGQADSSVHNKPATTAGIIVIGDEILKGQTQDTNTFFLAQKLHNFGIKLQRVSVIPDDVEVIAQEVKSYSQSYEVVITTGGIGPTHDDVTFEGVAKAFGDQLHHHPKIVDFVKVWFKTDDPSSPPFKLAHIPTKAKLHFGKDRISGEESKYPVISVENVFVLPGIPDLLRRIFSNSGQELFGYLSSQRFHVREVFLTEYETAVADRLNELVKSYPQVTFGSYPEWFNNYYKTKITIEATNLELLTSVEQKAKDMMPIMNYDKNPLGDASEKLENFGKSIEQDKEFKDNLEEALGTINKCLDDYKPEEIIVCFNGGKDCIVMLHLVHVLFKQRYPDKKLQAIYIQEKNPFPEVEDFILKSEKSHGLEALNYEGPMKQALERMLKEKSAIKAAILGTRKGDPGSHLQDLFSPTDGDWPKVMRVNPILNWQYEQVWKFIRGLSLPYPVLYDKGYTSLGSINNTRKNEALKYTDDDGREHYKPAHQLENAELEREGRT